MKVLLLADVGSPHTIKWAKGLYDKGIDISIFSMTDCDRLIYAEYPKIKLHLYPFPNELMQKPDGYFAKLQYLRVVRRLRAVMEQYRPDLIHAHYASSYGLIGALVNFHPYIISVWGSDVYDFPHKSVFHKMLLKYNFSKADKILSTSHIMAKEISLYTDKLVEVTAFGIDLDIFKPQVVENLFDENDIVIGTVKTLEEKYGIEYLIKAFAIVKNRHRELPLKLLIVGGGSQAELLGDLVITLDLCKDTIFTGKVPYIKVPQYHNMLSVSVSVSVSNSESFGVAVIEASACGKPVIVSNVGGLPEVVEAGITGVIVEPRNPEQTAKAIELLVMNKQLRMQMGDNGRKRVWDLYNWANNVEQMVAIYSKVLIDL